MKKLLVVDDEKDLLEVARYRFEKEGTFEYACTIHPGMTGTIVVTSAK